MKRSGWSLASNCIGITNFIYVAARVSEMAATDNAGKLTLILATPFMVCMGIGLLLGWLGWLMKMSGLILTSAILETTCIGLMPPWCIIVVIPATFGYIGYAYLTKEGKKL